ncbi:MAG: hypothetical protein AAB288_13375 [Acidobacteriota bacterium]
MLRLSLIVALLVAPLAAALEDGVYETDDAGRPAKQVKLNVTRGHILSGSNANDEWSLFVCYSPDGFLEGNKYAVVLNGKISKIGSWGKSGTTENDFSLALKSNEVDAAGKLFGFHPIERKHNGYKLDVTFTPDKETYTPGEKITIKMTIKNVSDSPFYFRVGGQNRGPRDDQFSFSCEGPDGTVPAKSAMNHGGISVAQRIEPGKEYSKEVDLAGWFDLKKPGHYSLIGSFELSVYETKELRSFEIWEDFLTRRFHLQVKAP